MNFEPPWGLPTDPRIKKTYEEVKCKHYNISAYIKAFSEYDKRFTFTLTKTTRQLNAYSRRLLVMNQRIEGTESWTN